MLRKRRDGHVHLVRQILLLDIPSTLMFLALWTWLELAEPLLLFALLSLRVPLWMSVLYRLIEPLRAWNQLPRAMRSDEALLRADAAMQTFAARFTRIYVGSFAVVQLLALVSALIRIPSSAPPLGPTELLIGALLVLVLVGPAQVGLRGNFQLMATAHLDELSAEILARRLTPARPKISLRSELTRFSTAQASALMLVAATAAIWIHGEEHRAHGVETQRHLVELAGERLRHGEALPSGVELHTRRTLPEKFEAALAEATLAGLSGEGLGAIHDRHRSEVIAALELPDGRLLTAASASEERLLPIALTLLLSGGVLYAMTVYWASVYFRQISAPLERIADATGGFTEFGELRELERIAPVRNDELGRLATRLNGLFDVLDELTRAAQRVAAGQLNIRLQRPGALHDAFRAMVNRLADLVTELRETSVELALASAQIQSLTQQQDQAVRQQSDNVDEVASSLATLAGSALQIAQATEGVVTNTQRASSMSESVGAEIDSLRTQLGGVSELLGQMREIADRSDLLALNGALEAERAGEVGRGFALVADEMRRLAERIAKILADASQRIETIEATGLAAHEVAASGRDTAELAAGSAASIAEVTTRQSEQSLRAAEGMESLAAIAEQTSRLTAHTSNAAEGLRRKAQRLEGLLSEFQR